MEIIIILLLIIISILSVGAITTFIIIGFIIIGFIIFILIGHNIENREIREKKRQEYEKEYAKQRRAYLNGEISEEEFEYMPKTEKNKQKLYAIKAKLAYQNNDESIKNDDNHYLNENTKETNELLIVFGSVAGFFLLAIIVSWLWNFSTKL